MTNSTQSSARRLFRGAIQRLGRTVVGRALGGRGAARRTARSVQPLVLNCRLSPGDVVMLTAAVRDLHRAHPGRFLTDVRTPAGDLWQNNPHITPLDERAAGVRSIEMHYPLIHQSNQRPYHFLHGYAQFLEQQLQLQIPLTEFKGDIHLSGEERGWLSQVAERGYRGPFWIVLAGGKSDFTAKWWNPKSFQAVVDHFAGRLPFVQAGESAHWHPPLEGVLNLVGRTSIRQFVRLVHHAEGVLCPVTFAMHLAAAVPTRPGTPRNRACVVVAGGREPPHWEAYPHHRFLSTNGALSCCDDGGCWKSRCQPMADGDSKDSDRCVDPIQIGQDLQIARCMDMIRPADVIRHIELYYEAGSRSYATPQEWSDFQKACRQSAASQGAVRSRATGMNHDRSATEESV